MPTLRSLGCALLCALFLAGPALAGPPSTPDKLDRKAKKALVDQLKAIFEAWKDPAKQDQLLAALKRHPPLHPKDAQYLAKMCFKLNSYYGLKIPKGGTIQFPCGEGDKTAECITMGGRAGKGLWIGLHGGAPGVGDGKEARSNWSAGASVGNALYPTVLKPSDMSWQTLKGYVYVQRLLNAAIRTWNVDTNQVYLSGHSMGGYGTWMFGCRFADRFAGLIAGAGGGYGPGVPTNLFNTPIRFYHSTDDPRVGAGSDQANARELEKLHGTWKPGYTFQYDEYDNIGHGMPPGGTAPLIKWIRQYKRDPYPKTLSWYPDPDCDGIKKQFAWLYAAKKPSQYKRILAQWKGNDLSIKLLPGEEGETADGAAGLMVLLSPELVDYGKEVTITVDGQQVAKGYPTYDLWSIVLSIYRRGDQKQYFTGHMLIPGDDDDDDDDDDDSGEQGSRSEMD